MIAIVFDDAAADLQQAVDFYDLQTDTLGSEFLVEFRKSVDRILLHPDAWPKLDELYRRCRFHRFPYGIIYRTNVARGEVIIVAIMHLSRRPDWWHDRR